VFTVGHTVGLANEEVNPLGLLVHEYWLPDTAAQPMVVHDPVQTVLGLPTQAAGSGLTVITTELVLEHPVVGLVSVRKIVVVVTRHT
jgi:hypothetical protein